LIETILKVGAMLVIVASISQYDPQSNRLEVLTITKTVLVVVASVLAAIHVLLIPQRLLEREICAVCFMICQALTHIIVPVIVLTSDDNSTQFVFCWAVLNFFGDIVKFAFLKVEDEFEVHLLTRQRLFALTGVTCFLYFVIMVLVVITWTVDYVVV
jgi:cell division protein FtsW (lipid II flippase)